MDVGNNQRKTNTKGRPSFTLPAPILKAFSAHCLKVVTALTSYTLIVYHALRDEKVGTVVKSKLWLLPLYYHNLHHVPTVQDSTQGSNNQNLQFLHPFEKIIFNTPYSVHNATCITFLQP